MTPRLRGALANAMPRSKSAGEALIESIIFASGLFAIVVVVLIFVFLLREGLPAIVEVGAGSLLGARWYPIEALFGLAPLLYGSLVVTFVAVVIAVPLGLTTAIFLGELAPQWMRDILKPTIEILAGIPSIVLGFFGWVALAPAVQGLGASTGLTAFTGGVVLAYMALPTIISIAEDALAAVPKRYRDGAMAIGATHWQATYRVVLPAARSGLVMAVILGIGRAVGETMAVLMITGNAAQMPVGRSMLLEPVRTMTATIAAEMGEVARGSPHYHVLFLVGIVLFLVTFAINAAASRIMGLGGAGGGR